MLTKQTVIDKIEVLEAGQIQVRRATFILEDGKRIAGPSYHRTTYAPGADVVDEDARIKAVAAAVWTTEIVSADETSLATKGT